MGALVVGALLGAAGDAVTRATASVPMTVGGFIFLILALVAGVFLWAREPR